MTSRPRRRTVLAPGLPALAEEIIEAISEGVPEYALPLEGAFGRGLRRGVEEALRRFLDLFGTEGDEADPRREIYVELGRGELRAGRPLEALLAAYRLGARVAWRRQAAAGEAAGPRAPDALPAGRVDLRLHRRDLRRVGRGLRARAGRGGGGGPAPPAALARLLVQDPPADPEAVAGGGRGRRAGRFPDAVAAVVVRTEEPDALALRLGQGAIAVARPAGAVRAGARPGRARPPGPARAVALGGQKAALGPTGPWTAAPLSAQRRPLGAGAGGRTGLVVADDHRLELLLAADPRADPRPGRRAGWPRWTTRPRPPGRG